MYILKKNINIGLVSRFMFMFSFAMVGLFAFANVSTATGPVITIAPYTTEQTNKDITVTATVSNGVLVTPSHTFTENGSFDFVAQDSNNYVTTKQVVITNIDKSKVLGAESFHFTQLLKPGSKGNEVMELQKFLNNAGYTIGTPNGFFGPKTKAAVIKFQIANNLKGDGIVGAMGRAILNK